MYKRHIDKRYEVSESSDYDDQKPERDFLKFYDEKKRMRPGTSSETENTTKNKYLQRKKIGNAYSERNVKKPSSCRAKRKLKEAETKAKTVSTTDYLDFKDPDGFNFENLLHKEAFDLNYEELNFLEETLFETIKAQHLTIKSESSDENIIRKVFPITYQKSEIIVFEDENKPEEENEVIEKFVKNDFWDMVWSRFIGEL